MTVYYYSEGDIRGRCPHNHRTLRGAALCLRRDRAGCAAQGGYSDRALVRSDGEPLDGVETDAVDQYVSGYLR